LTDNSLKKSALTVAVLDRVPPLIRMSLLSDQSFREEFGLSMEATISLGVTGPSVQRSDLFNAIRSVLAKGDTAKVTDAEGDVWNLKNEAGVDELPKLVLSSLEQRLILPELAGLSEDASTRIRSLEEAASDVNLPLSAQEKWRNMLAERALEDDEVDTFISDLRDTPVYLERSVREEIAAGKSSASSLVPNSRRYFERLVGVYDGSTSIRDYATGPGRNLFEQLTAWRPYEGFLFSLLLSSHSALTTEISVDLLNEDELVQAFDFVGKHGDMLSRLGAFEVGLRVLPQRPEVEPFLLHLVQRIRDDHVEGDVSEFQLFSALFILVDGELSRIRLMSEKPPFYRRLASLAQAALIHRQLVQYEVDYDHFSQWAISNRGEHYYMQSFADMRIEPRWNPDFADPLQIKADYFGRIMITGHFFEKNLGAGALRDNILVNGPQSLLALYKFPYPFFPGPLEGAEDSPNTLPDDFARVIEEQLDSSEVEASNFIALVNSAMLFKITSGHADLAANALRLGNYRLANLEDKSQLMNILSGLATVAAVSRNSALADELRILVHRYRRDSQYGLSIEEVLRICLAASAARNDLIEWRDFVGGWLTELAFGKLNGNEGGIIYSYLKALLHAVPELWISCAKADAALQAWRFR